MKKYIAFLRGINVGGNNKVPMARLKALFEESGFLRVSTYINSGNVIFETDIRNSQKIIEDFLQKEFSFAIQVIVREMENIKKLRKNIPANFVNDDKQRTDILFLTDDYANPKVLNLIKTTKVDNLKYIDGAIVWNLKKKDYNKSGMCKFIGSIVYKNMTARNVNTVRKLVDAFGNVS